MPTDLVRRINLDLIYPPFLDKLLDTVAACRDLGAAYFLNSGYRSFPEQAKLYFQGRTMPGLKVTNARPGYSCHNYGIAVDAVRDGDLVSVGLQPQWDEKGYDTLYIEGEARGIQVGLVDSRGKHYDFGHCQVKLPGKEIEDLEILKAIFESEGLPAVWKQLEKWGC